MSSLKLFAIIALLLVSVSNAKGQSVEFASVSPNDVYSPAVASGFDLQTQTSGCSSCAGNSNVPHAPVASTCADAGCCLPGPTVTPIQPQLPVNSCCNNFGPLNVPRLTTPLRHDTPPIGRSAGRPIIGRWSGF